MNYSWDSQNGWIENLDADDPEDCFVAEGVECWMLAAVVFTVLAILAWVLFAAWKGL